MHSTSRKVGRSVLWTYRTLLARIFDPFGELSGILFIVGGDTHHRYRVVAAKVQGNRILDVGAGGRSYFGLRWRECVSMDLQRFTGVDIVGSATNLPFRSGVFDTVVSVDTLEHVPRNRRPEVVSELDRVSKNLTIVHVPLENGQEYLGRVFDMIFDRWYTTSKGKISRNTREHLDNVEPSTADMIRYNFSVSGTLNAKVWLSCMRLAFSFPWPVGLTMSHLWLWLNRRNIGDPPYWGAIAVRRHAS